MESEGSAEEYSVEQILDHSIKDGIKYCKLSIK